MNQLNEQKNSKSVIIYGVSKSTNATIEEKSREDKLKETEIFTATGKEDFN